MNKPDSLIKRNSLNEIEVFRAALIVFSSCIIKRVAKIEELLDNLLYENDPKYALGVLRHCFGSLKMVYTMRGNSPSAESKEILKPPIWFRAQLLKAFREIYCQVLHQPCLTID